MSHVSSMRSQLSVESLELRTVPGNLLTSLVGAVTLDPGLGTVLAATFEPAPASTGSSLPAEGERAEDAEGGRMRWDHTASGSSTTVSRMIPGTVATFLPNSRELLDCAGTLLLRPPARGPSLAPGATYLFNDHLFPEQEEAPWLIPLDPLGQNRFESAQLYGQERRVYRFDGSAALARENAGLMIGTQGLISPDNYTIEFVFESVERAGSYRKLLDVQDRQSDSSLYVSPSNVLNLYPDGAGVTELALNTFYHVVISNEQGRVNVYVNGTRDFMLPSTTTMTINNPLGLLYLFVDDEATSGEYGDARIGLLRFYEGALTPQDVAVLAQDPFAYP